MPGTFAVDVLAPEQALLSGPAESVVLRTAEGYLTVLDGHTPLIGTVEPGEVRVEQPEGGVVRIAVHGGFVQVDTSPGAAGETAGGDGPLPGLSTRVTVLVGVAELASDIDPARAQRSKDEADARLAELRSSSGPAAAEAEGERDSARRAEIIELEAKLRRAEVRLEVAAEHRDQ
jgi:F-type H+-transporting ATPase subunit epsilon